MLDNSLKEQKMRSVCSWRALVLIKQAKGFFFGQSGKIAPNLAGGRIIDRLRYISTRLKWLVEPGVSISKSGILLAYRIFPGNKKGSRLAP
jgi:hypothetical protein